MCLGGLVRKRECAECRESNYFGVCCAPAEFAFAFLAKARAREIKNSF